MSNTPIWASPEIFKGKSDAWVRAYAANSPEGSGRARLVKAEIDEREANHRARQEEAAARAAEMTARNTRCSLALAGLAVLIAALELLL